MESRARLALTETEADPGGDAETALLVVVAAAVVVLVVLLLLMMMVEATVAVV